VSLAAASSAPGHLTRYLLNGEQIVVAVRRHPAQVFEPVASAIAGLAVTLWLQTRIPPDLGVLSDVLWPLWAVLLGRALIRLSLWRVDWFVATDSRLLLTYGILTRKVAMMPLMKVTDMSYNRSVLGRLFGYGQFVLESAGHDQALHVVSWLPNPDALYRLICAEIFDPRRFGPGGARRPETTSLSSEQAAPPLRPHVDDEDVALDVDIEDAGIRPASRWTGFDLRLRRDSGEQTVDISDD
jgi:hypothetical protein